MRDCQQKFEFTGNGRIVCLLPMSGIGGYQSGAWKTDQMLEVGNERERRGRHREITWYI